MIRRNFIVKSVENFSEHNAKISPGNSLPYREILKTKMISLSYDDNNHVYCKSKFICSQSKSPSQNPHESV